MSAHPELIGALVDQEIDFLINSHWKRQRTMDLATMAGLVEVAERGGVIGLAQGVSNYAMGAMWRARAYDTTRSRQIRDVLHQAYNNPSVQMIELAMRVVKDAGFAALPWPPLKSVLYIALEEALAEAQIVESPPQDSGDAAGEMATGHWTHPYFDGVLVTAAPLDSRAQYQDSGSDFGGQSFTALSHWMFLSDAREALLVVARRVAVDRLAVTAALGDLHAASAEEPESIRVLLNDCDELAKLVKVMDSHASRVQSCTTCAGSRPGMCCSCGIEIGQDAQHLEADPHAQEIRGDDRLHLQCQSCLVRSKEDI